MRRSFVIVAVLIVVASSILVATGLLFVMQADLATDAGAVAGTQSRLLAWSGVQAVMTELDQQRERILLGEAAEVTDEFVIYETDGREGVVRLLPLGLDGAVLVPEAGRLDLNVVDATMLEATGMVDRTLAEAIVAHRDGARRGTLQSVAELLAVPGMTAEILYGPLADVRGHDEPLELGHRLADERLAGEGAAALADVVTVFGFEPALQRDGKLRINLNVEWSDELAERVDERFGEGSGDVLKQIFDRGTTFDSEARVYQVMRRFNTELDEWPDIVDALTTEEGEEHYGRLDINTASYEALLGLPTIEPEHAQQIVRARDALDAETRSTVAWLAQEGIVEPVAYDDLAGRVTTRSWTYRLRIMAGERNQEPGAGEDVAPIEDAVTYDVVIDLCDPAPRVAYLREVTMLPTTAALLAIASADAEGFDDSEGPGGPDGLDEIDEPGDDGRRAEEPRPGPGAPSAGPPASPPPRGRRLGRWKPAG